VAEIDRAFSLIDESPERWPAYVGATRRFLLGKFPFSIVYRARAGSILVLAVAHAKRRPGYWRTRETGES
jgi:hypothetical protein